MTKMSALGIIFASPFLIYRLGDDIPALYPSIDLFMAPFLAGAIIKIDDALAAEESGDVIDDVFFASFSVLSGIGMILAGTMLLLASKFKLANLGAFLPYPVLAGFFSAVGVLIWGLSFSVDSNGKKWQDVLFSGDINLIWNSGIHHAPSLIMGIIMKILGPKHPFFVVILVIVSILSFYVVMWIAGVTLEDAQEAEWFWKPDELVYNEEPGIGFTSWSPPAPFGVVKVLLFDGTVHWGAVANGLTDMIALAILKQLQSSIHAPALKKNSNNLVRKVRTYSDHHGGNNNNGGAKRTGSGSHSSSTPTTFASQIYGRIRKISADFTSSVATTERFRNGVAGPLSPYWFRDRHGKRRTSELISEDIESSVGSTNDRSKSEKQKSYKEIRPKTSRRTLQEIIVDYGYSLFIVAFVGGFGNCPMTATSTTMYAIGAEHAAPQYGSALLLVIFYLTDFQLVRFIPKTAFSSLLVLGAVDTFVVWFFKSFRKTKDILEWLVVPFIIVFSLVVGFLNAIFLGIGISTFVFVASFFRAGVVKFVATGLEIHSTIERPKTNSDWLDTHGDFIQILVLQNYLFFGNAYSILSYITTMFEEIDEETNDDSTHKQSFSLPPVPKVLVIEMSLITGMDTSTVDIFEDIKELCKNNGCKLFFCGLSPRLRSSLASGGVEPESGVRSKRLVRFFPNLDTALGKAEDLLVQQNLEEKDKRPSVGQTRLPKEDDSGFRYALKQIDEQHNKDFASGLIELQPFTVPIVLELGDHLFESEGGKVPDSERGLFFIESGMMKIERDATESLTLTRGNSMTRSSSTSTLNQLSWGAVGRQTAAIKSNSKELTTQNLRLARIGPGWVCGAIEGASGLRNPGIHTAVSHCRLHHLPFCKIEEIEKDHPLLILKLYKMLSHLMASRQETTISQLTTLHSIMSSPAHSKPLSRRAIQALSKGHYQ